MMVNNRQEPRQSRAKLIYYGDRPFFADQLTGFLSSSLPVEQEVRNYHFSGDSNYYVLPLLPINDLATALPDIAEIVLIFATTTLATSALNKLGEDLYQWLKGKVVKHGKAKREEMATQGDKTEIPDMLLKKERQGTGVRLVVIINNTTILEGFSSVADYATLIEVIKATEQVVLNLEHNAASLSEAPQSPTIKIMTYNSSAKKWEGVSNDRPQLPPSPAVSTGRKRSRSNSAKKRSN